MASSHFGDERTGEPGWERGAWHLLGGDTRVDTSRKRDLKKDHEASMSEDSSEFQGVEERRLFIFEKSALSYNHTRRWGSLREGCEG